MTNNPNQRTIESSALVLIEYQPAVALAVHSIEPGLLERLPQSGPAGTNPSKSKTGKREVLGLRPPNATGPRHL
jgi:hypothetical protein